MSAGAVEGGVRVHAAGGRCSGELFHAADDDITLPLIACVHGGGCHGGYFAAAGASSTLFRARARRHPVLLIDRPGYGGSPLPAGACPVADSVAIIAECIEEVRAAHLPATRDVALIGHSIGAAVVLAIAAEARPFPLSAVAASGVGEAPPPGSGPWPPLPEGTKGSPPGLLSSDLFFGSPGSFEWGAVRRLRRVSEPWLLAEISEIMNGWPRRWRGLAGAIDVPVHLRLAEDEAIWCTGPAVIDRMRAAMVRSPQVDAALLPDGGHLYELHRRGSELVDAQLDFIAHHVGPKPGWEKRAAMTGMR